MKAEYVKALNPGVNHLTAITKLYTHLFSFTDADKHLEPKSSCLLTIHMIDSVDVDPPIQIGIPFKCKGFMQRYKKKPVICSAGGKSYIFTRRHIVTQLNFRCHYTLWGYALQEAMRNGGNLSCAQFTGTDGLIDQISTLPQLSL